MKTTTVAVVAGVTAGCVGTVHEEPSQVSAVEVRIYKLDMSMGCRDGGRGRGDPAAQVESFCTCVLNTLEDRMTANDWRRAAFFAQQRRDRDEREVLAPHMPYLAQCRERG